MTGSFSIPTNGLTGSGIGFVSWKISCDAQTLGLNRNSFHSWELGNPWFSFFTSSNIQQMITTIRFPFMKVLNSCDGSFIEFSFAIPKRSKEKRILESHEKPHSKSSI
jgi:hypothetical protein